MPKSKISNEAFVEAYMSAKTYDKLAKELNISKDAIFGRAKYLRSKGVNLPFKGHASAVNVGHLNRIIMAKKVNKD